MTTGEFYLCLFQLHSIRKGGRGRDDGTLKLELEALAALYCDDGANLHAIAAAGGEAGEIEGIEFAKWFERKRWELSATPGWTLQSVDALALSGFASLLRGEQPVEKNRKTNDGSTPEANFQKVLNALCIVHGYENGWCDNLTPAANKDLAKTAEVSPATMTRMLQKIFAADAGEAYAKYVVACQRKDLSKVLARQLGDDSAGGLTYQEEWGEVPSDRRRRAKASELGDEPDN